MEEIFFEFREKRSVRGEDTYRVVENSVGIPVQGVHRANTRKKC
jgi:hypothetical protein